MDGQLIVSEVEMIEEAPRRTGWVAVSISPQGRYFLAEDTPFCLTSDPDSAAVFDDYDNALASLEVFKDSIFVETEKQLDIMHFMRIEKTEDL